MKKKLKDELEDIAPKPEPKIDGRIDGKYKPEYCDRIIEFFSDYLRSEGTGKIRGIPTIVKFAKSIGVSRQTIMSWKDRYPEFKEAYDTAKDLKLDLLDDGALVGTLNPNYVKYMVSCEYRRIEPHFTQNVNATVTGEMSEDDIKLLNRVMSRLNGKDDNGNDEPDDE